MVTDLSLHISAVTSSFFWSVLLGEMANIYMMCARTQVLVGFAKSLKVL